MRNDDLLLIYVACACIMLGWLLRGIAEPDPPTRIIIASNSDELMRILSGRDGV